jgi:hypothetical protein
MEPIKITTLEELQKNKNLIESIETKVIGRELFTSYLWLETWLSVYSDKYEWTIFLFVKDGTGIAYLPLVFINGSWMKIPIRRIEIASISSHGNIIHLPHNSDSELIWDALFKSLAENSIKWDLLYLEGFPDDDKDIINIDSIVKKYGFSVHRGDLVQIFNDWVLPINGDWDSYYNSLSKNLKKSIKNQQNKAEKNVGEIKILHYESGDNFEKMWQKLIRIDQASWQYRANCAVSSKKNLNFYRRLAENFLNRGFDLWLLEINGEPVAFEYSIIYNENVYALRWGYNPEFKAFGPGKLLRYNSLQYYFEKKLNSISFMGKYDDFKKLWNPEMRHSNDIFIFNTSPSGRIVNTLGFRMGIQYLKNKITGFDI